jgi:hypothetical protein
MLIDVLDVVIRCVVVIDVALIVVGIIFNDIIIIIISNKIFYNTTSA